MKSIKPIAYLILLAVAGFLVWYFFFPPPEKVIKKRLEKLAASISAAPSGNIAIIANVNTIASFFHPEVSISVEGFGREVQSIQGRGEIQQMALGARQRVGRIEVKFYNIDVLVNESKTSAEVLMTALVNIGDQTDAVVQNLKMQMELVDKKWLVRSVIPISQNLQMR